MAFMAVLESDLRALSAEARRRYPAVKDGAEHAILKLRSLSSPSEIAHNDDIIRIFLMACEVRTVKLSIIGLSCLQKLISHDAVSPSALRDILSTLKDHAEMVDEGVQLKTLQTISIIFQSRLHPENEDTMSQALGICLRLLENSRSSDSVRNTAAATFRQAVALIFDRVVLAESLPAGKFGFGGQLSRTSSVTGDVNRSINLSDSLDHESTSGEPPAMREALTETGKLGLRLLEDLTSLAAGGSAIWLRVNILQRTFSLDILEFILSNYAAVFRTLLPYEQVLRRQICSLLMTSLRTNAELEGEAGEPSFRRLVMRSVAHIIRLYSSSLVTECEVFLSMLLKATFLDLPLWHRILVLEILRGFCVEARTLRILFQNFDMNPKNTNVVEGMVKALARVVSNVQVQESSEESLAAVAGMFSSKAKGIEWSLDNDASNSAVLVASEAHAITLAVEGLLGVVFTVATLTDEAIDVGETRRSMATEEEPDLTPPSTPPPSPVATAVPIATAPPIQPLITFTLKISDKLDEKNFLVWRQQVEPMINAHNLQSFIHFPDVPLQFLSDSDRIAHKENPLYRNWLKQDQWLLSWLQSTLSGAIMPRVLGCVHAFQLWDRLHDHFQKLTRAKARQLRTELRATTLDSRTVDEYLLCIKTIINNLASVGDPVPLAQHIDVILEGLPQEFAPVISVIESKFETMELEEVEALLLAHEMRSEKFKKKSDSEVASINLTHSVPGNTATDTDSSQQTSGNTTPNPNSDNNAFVNQFSGNFRGRGGRNGRSGRGRFGNVQCQVCFKFYLLITKAFHLLQIPMLT